jgi:hypothetical protein
MAFLSPRKKQIKLYSRFLVLSPSFTNETGAINTKKKNIDIKLRNCVKKQPTDLKRTQVTSDKPPLTLYPQIVDKSKV